MNDVFDILKQMRNENFQGEQKQNEVTLSLKIPQQEIQNIPQNNDVDFTLYMKTLQKTIKSNWNPPKENKSKHIVVLFKIRKDGQLLSAKIAKTSGFRNVDNAALNAIQLSSPFKRLPSDFEGHSIDIQFTFNYNIQTESQNKSIILSNENIQNEDDIKEPNMPKTEHQKNNSNNDDFSLYLFLFFCLCGIWYLLYNFFIEFLNLNLSNAVTGVICGFITASAFWYYKDNPPSLSIKFKQLESDLTSKNKIIESYKEYSKNLKMQNDYFLNNISAGMNYLSDFIADNKTLNYEWSEYLLKNKKRPAYAEAQRIAELKKETREYIKEFKLMRYEYEYLFNVFPELENYIEFYGQENNVTLEEVKDNYDYVKKWVSNEEFKTLNENERNQLALDNYIASRKKNKWQIGRDYEMFIGHEYEKQGYKVEYTGIVKRIEDLGRDLIVKNQNEILIVQCKNWSKHKVIHENHICQLFGTVIQYNIENNQKATPVFITTTTLSETAIKFAEYLGIRVVQNKEFKDFPRIKCNINRGEKIYHLPFDQQYDRTIIDNKKGEFFAWTVKEAVDNGFRRAKKYFFTDK